MVAGLHEEPEDDGQARIYETRCRPVAHLFHIHCLETLIPIDIALHNGYNGHNGLYGLPNVPCPLCRHRIFMDNPPQWAIDAALPANHAALEAEAIADDADFLADVARASAPARGEPALDPFSVLYISPI